MPQDSRAKPFFGAGPKPGRLDVELDAQFNSLERALTAKGARSVPSRPASKQMVDPATGEWSLDWKAYFARLRLSIERLATAPAGFVFSPPAAQLQLAGLAPSLFVDRLISVPAGAMSISGLAPSPYVDRLIQTPAGALNMAGQVPTLFVDQLIDVAPAAMQLAGLVPGVSVLTEINAPSGAMQLAGLAPTIDIAGLTTISLFASATNDDNQITVPANIEAGDLIVVLNKVINDGEPTTVIPSGFSVISNLHNTTGNDLRQIVSRKLATGSEGGTTLSGMVGSFEEEMLLYVFRGNIPATSLTVGSLNEQTADGNPTAQNVAGSSGSPPLVVFACYGAGDPVSPRSFSPAKDGEISEASGSTWLAYKIYNSSPADVTVDMDDEGDRNTLQSFYIEMS